MRPSFALQWHCCPRSQLRDRQRTPHSSSATSAASHDHQQASPATWQPRPRELPCGAVQKSRRLLHCTNNDKSQTSNGELMFKPAASHDVLSYSYTQGSYEPPSHRFLLRETLNVPPCTISFRALWSTVTVDVASLSQCERTCSSLRSRSFRTKTLRDIIRFIDEQIGLARRADEPCAASV